MSIVKGRDILEKLRPTEEYFYIDNLTIKSATWENRYEDFARWKIGNCFKSESEANDHMEHLIMVARLKNFADANNDAVMWNGKTTNYVLCYKHNLAAIEIVPCTYQNYGCIIFTSPEIAKAAINEFGEKQIIKNYFRVKGG